MVSFLKRYLIIRGNKLTPEIQQRFLQQLSRFLANGYSLLEALNIIKWDKQLISVANEIIVSLKSGSTIDEAFVSAKFHNFITSYLYFTKTNSDLEGSVKKCLQLFNNRLEYSRKIRQIMRYPLILLFFFSILLYFIKNHILPTFIDLFQSSSEASATAVIFLMVIDYLSLTLIIIIVILLIGFMFWRINKQKLPIEIQLKIYYYLPIYRWFIKIQTTYLFSTHISTLLKAGMPIKTILQNMSDQKQLPIISYYANLMITELQRGFPVAHLLFELPFIEKQFAMIFQNNSNIDDLGRDLTVYAELLTEELHRKMMKYITYIQPVFLIILASFIVFIYVTLMWPMFQLIKTV